MKISIVLVFFSLLASCQSKRTQEVIPTPEGITPVVKSEEQWKSELSPMEYNVLRQAGTERAGTGDLLSNKEKGIYTCRGCALPLFHSETKFDSGTGWPSYYQPINDVNVEEDTDYKLLYPRTEVHCARCKGHLGHVFKDGPPPTGLRYCINSVSLDFISNLESEQNP